MIFRDVPWRRRTVHIHTRMHTEQQRENTHARTHGGRAARSLVGLGEEAVEGGEDLGALRAEEAPEGVLAVPLALLRVLQHRALPVALVHPHVRVHEDVPGELEDAHPRHERHGRDQRVDLHARTRRNEKTHERQKLNTHDGEATFHYEQRHQEE